MNKHKCSNIQTSYKFIDDSFVHRRILLDMLCRAAVLIFGLSFAVQAQMNFTIQPMSVVQAKGLNAMFECLHSGVVLYGWIVDGVSSASSEFPLESPTGGATGVPSVLTIPATDQYNGTVVLCGAVSLHGDFPSETSEIATLTVLGISVVNIIDSTDTITLLWNKEYFTTNIKYCVKNNQLGSSETVPLDPVCRLTGPEYIFPSPGHYVCDRFFFIVTPTEGDMNGTSSEPVTGFFTRATGTGGETCAVDDGSNETESVIFQAIVPDCTNFTSYRVDSDLLSAPISRTLESLPRTNVSIHFTLPADQMTNVNVTLTDTSGVDLVFENIVTSTHDTKNITAVPCPDNCSLCVTVEYIEGSDAGGALVCAIPLMPDNQLTLEDTILVSIPRDNSQNFSISVPAGTYEVLAFDIESNNLPKMSLSVAAVSINKPVQICGDAPTESPSDDSGITSTKLSNGVEVTCPVVDVNCLILVQLVDDVDQAAVRLIRSSDSDRTIQVNFTRNSSGVIFFIAVYTYTQSIFNGRVSHIELLQPPTTPPLTATTTLSTLPSVDTPSGVPTLSEGEIAGITIIVLFLLVVMVAVVVVVCLVVRLRRKRIQSTQQDGVAMQAVSTDGRVDWSTAFPGIEQPNEAYSTVMNRNIAYEKPVRHNPPHNPPPSEGNVGEYEEIEPVHEYEEVLPQRRVNNPQYVNIDTSLEQ